MLHAMVIDPLSSSGFAPYAGAFGQGVLIDFTPCVYPLIPITVAVFGAKGVSRARALFLASAYVLGMAALYTGLGIFAALTGTAFGTWLSNPWVVIPIAGLLVALALSMFGAFELQLPSHLQTKLTGVGGAGPVGALLMGLVSGFISAPCTGPALLGLLTYIGKSAAEGSGVLHGASLMFVYALGMGTIFFAVALGASLFRAGPWMESVKSVFGIVLLVEAFWFLRPLHPAFEDFILHPSLGLPIGIAIVGAGVAAGAVHLSFHGPRAQQLHKGAAVFLATFGSIASVNSVFYTPRGDWHEVATLSELEAEIRAAETSGRPLVIDFSARWCLPCKEMELLTFHDPRVEPRLARNFHLVKIDVTDPNPEQTAMASAFASQTLPSVLVYPADAGLTEHLGALGRGELVPAPAVHFKSFTASAEFLSAIDSL